MLFLSIRGGLLSIIVIILSFFLFLRCEPSQQPQSDIPDVDSLPVHSFSDDTLPNDTVPSDTAMNDDTIPHDTVQNDTIPNDTIPADTVSKDTTTTIDSIPDDTLLNDTLVNDTLPNDTILTDTVTNDIIPYDTIPEDTLTQNNKGLTIYFIRHAETVANASGEIGGGGNLEDHDTLTELGMRQVEELKDYLINEDIRPDLVIVSPASRTQKTIEPFLVAKNYTAEIWVELNECCGDEPTGEPLPTERPEPRWKMEIDIVAENVTYRTEADKYYWWPQSYEEGLFMVMTARDRLLERFGQSGTTIIIVGHAVNGNILLGLLRGYDMITEEPERFVWLMNAGIQKLVQDRATGEITLERQNINDPSRE